MCLKKPLLCGLLVLSFTASALAAEPVEPAHTGVIERAVDATSSAIQTTRSGIESLVDRGMSFIGITYRFGGNGPETGGFDCSGLVRKVFGDALGLSLPRTAAEMSKQGDKVAKTELKPGDLVFFNTMRRAFSHVGIYLGDNKFLHAPSKGGKVRVESMEVGYWQKRFNGARRVLPEEQAAVQAQLATDAATAIAQP